MSRNSLFRDCCYCTCEGQRVAGDIAGQTAIGGFCAAFFTVFVSAFLGKTTSTMLTIGAVAFGVGASCFGGLRIAYWIYKAANRIGYGQDKVAIQTLPDYHY